MAKKKKKRLPRQTFKFPKPMSDVEALRKLKATPVEKLPEPRMLEDKPQTPKPQPQDAAGDTGGREDGIRVEYDDGKTTGFEGLTQHQLLERIAVLLEKLPRAIGQEIVGGD